MPYLISLETFEAVRERLKSGSPDFSVISKELGVSEPTVARIAEGKHYYQCDSAEQGRRRESWAGRQPKYLPTPEQIETECVRLRAERKPNKVDDSDGWTPPVVSPGTLD